ncbi:hypothetical protein HDU86_001851 [Geranomyces michiganensis]|nr:hypothetical protein HDU86_001851 [Geranomyces michiganensis]
MPGATCKAGGGGAAIDVPLYSFVGYVGALVAYALIVRRVASEILLVDLDQARCDAQVLDLSDAAHLYDTHVRSAATPTEAGQCDIVVICAGAKQRPGETRIDLVGRNKTILASVIDSMKPFKKETVLLLVSNPVDVLTYIAQKLSGLPAGQVIGSGTFLDSVRLRGELAKTLDVAETAVHAYVLGEHGDSQFVAWSSASVGNTPLMSMPQIQNLDRRALADAVRNKAYRIIETKGFTQFGIGAVVAQICESIILDLRHVRPLSHYVDELGVCVSLPDVLGHKGVRGTLKPPLTAEEEQQLRRSAEALKEGIKAAGL